MPKVAECLATVPSLETHQMYAQITHKKDEAKHVKIVVFDDQNRVLAVKSKNRFVLPYGRVE